MATATRRLAGEAHQQQALRPYQLITSIPDALFDDLIRFAATPFNALIALVVLVEKKHRAVPPEHGPACLPVYQHGCDRARPVHSRQSLVLAWVATAQKPVSAIFVPYAAPSASCVQTRLHWPFNALYHRQNTRLRPFHRTTASAHRRGRQNFGRGQALSYIVRHRCDEALQLATIADRLFIIIK